MLHGGLENEVELVKRYKKLKAYMKSELYSVKSAGTSTSNDHSTLKRYLNIPAAIFTIFCTFFIHLYAQK